MVIDEEIGAHPAPGPRVDDGCALTRRLGVIGVQVDRILNEEMRRLSDGEIEQAIVVLHELAARMTAVRGQALAEARDRGFAVRHGASDLAEWLRGRLVLTPTEARRRVGLARATVEGPCRATGQALAAGEISAEHAWVICQALRRLPREVDDEQRGAVEQFLLDQASVLDQYQLVKLAARLRERLTAVDPSPGGADPRADSRSDEHNDSGRSAASDPNPEAARPGLGGLTDRGPDPAAVRELTLTDTAAGTALLNGELDAEGAALLRTALDQLAAPRPGENDPSDQRSPARRRADALIDLVSLALSADAVPSSGGTRPHLSVMIPWATLVGSGSEPASTNWGMPLPRSLLARLSCDAAISRIVLDPEGIPLDVGRTTRTIPPHVRRAVAVRDRGCVFAGCDRPPSWTDCHHVVHWTRGGVTAPHNLVLLCPEHHRRVHREGWEIVFAEDQRPTLIPPRRIDPLRRPRRNPYSQPPADLFIRTA
ncbi:HNH endonuclease signature motif containing protein [Frankia sp. AgKG'84/4]|uniref:HNH endonuclease signature motif containing protein n=1 Tax=Frankia sp. AgKG'84/4 TaxID=573490 RepID=UPI002010C0AA|nr:HNH endonuclease signature motif containing protein [Frankia sp. AgKG'84/4]MCL9794332.1 HNH endonuclease [Frankia sp. AgKG'84/4]